MEFEVQTRSENGDIKLFPTLKEAMEYANKSLKGSWGDSVWKVSFPVSSGERCRLVLERGFSPKWVYESMQEAIDELRHRAEGDDYESSDNRFAGLNSYGNDIFGRSGW